MMKFYLPLTCLLVGIGISWIAKPFLLENVVGPLVANSSAGSSQSSLVPDKARSAGSQEERGKARPSQDASRAMSGEQEAVEERNERRKQGARVVNNQHRKEFEVFFAKRISQLKLTPDQQAKIRDVMAQYFSEREKRFVLGPDDYVEKPHEHSALFDGNGLEEFAAALLTDEQKSLFDSTKAKEQRDRINSKAFLELGNLVTVLDLTEEQKDGAHGVLFKLIAKDKDSEIPEKSKGLSGVFIERYGIETEDALGINAMMHKRLEEHGDYSFGEDDNKIIAEAISKRIVERVEAMRPVLTEPELEKYREHLETTTAERLEIYDITGISFDHE